jgi:hypothetical protein
MAAYRDVEAMSAPAEATRLVIDLDAPHLSLGIGQKFSAVGQLDQEFVLVPAGFEHRRAGVELVR